MENLIIYCRSEACNKLLERMMAFQKQKRI